MLDRAAGAARDARAPGVAHHSPPPAGRLRRRQILLFALLGILALNVPAYVLVPASDTVRVFWYDAIAAVSLAVGFAGLRLHRPQHARGWLLVLVGYSGWVLGDIVWSIEQQVVPELYPVPSDGVYLTSYLVLGAGVLVFARSRRGRDLPALLDASIVAIGTGVLVAVFVIAPLAAGSGLSAAGNAVSSAYPLGDLFLLGVLMRISAGPAVRSASFRLLAASVGVTLVSDLTWNFAVALAGDSVSVPLIDTGWLAGYVLVAAAACSSSMRTLAEPGPDRREVMPSRSRLLALTAGLMLPGVALLLDGATGGAVRWPVIGAGALVLSVLVLLRMVGLVHVVQAQAVRLAALASSDSLTGAPNRRTWDHELSSACQVSRDNDTALSVAVLDLDHFKAYNDANGHQAGDRLLREAVAAWTDVLPAGALLARYGGEEFAVLFPATGPQVAAAALEELRAVTPDRQTFSAGVARWDPATDPATAIAAADEALYVAKRAGRDRVVVHGVTPSIPQPRRPRPLPDFATVVQPITDLRTFAVSGHEALTRFTGPEAASGVQAVFQAAHEDGDGDLLELAAVLAGLRLADRPAGQDLYVNVSARALTSERFIAGLPSRLDGIVVELGENVDGVELDELADVVARLRTRGARMALDDVGAGAQEFARLARLRPDVVKIDRSLVSGCAHDRGNEAVLRALVAYAADMRLTLCAEGVEDVADLRQLVALGVTHAQGYLLGRPGTWQQSAVPAGTSVISLR
jgi:diguanylate cyclase (GGDEF)-like protein